MRIYRISGHFPKQEDYCLTSQMRRAAISIPANIAEGYTRANQKEQLRFYNIADASLSELQYFILLARDLGYINEDEAREIYSQSRELGKVLGGWIRSQEK